MSDIINEQPRTREELYEKIKTSSKDQFVLDDMIRLGFWAKQGTIPQDPADEIRKKTELTKELTDLRKDLKNLNNEAFLLKQFRDEKLKESKRKRLENKIKKEALKKEKVEAWKLKQEKDIVYLGEQVSDGLNNNECDLEKLKINNLTTYNNPLELATNMGISLGLLRFLSFSRKVAKVSHYIRFQVPKKTGGFRTISSPMPKLKNAQYWILDNILKKIVINEKAHGFVDKKSIITNATPHLKADILINMDLKDFFPTLSYKRVKGLFKSLGYSEAIATILGLLCTEAEVQEIELDNKPYFVEKSTRKLPQGAPTSPAITNIICRRLDEKIAKIALDLNFTYTRYADDLTFSTSTENSKLVGKLMTKVKNAIAYEGFFVHPDKTKIIRTGGRKEVTGIVVNEKLSISKETLKKFRATLHQILRDGIEGKTWGTSPNILSSINGFYNFIKMVDPTKAEVFKNQLQEINRKFAYKPYKKIVKAEKIVITEKVVDTETNIIEDENKPKKSWWKLF